jgi:hypothetical protein
VFDPRLLIALCVLSAASEATAKYQVPEVSMTIVLQGSSSNQLFYSG